VYVPKKFHKDGTDPIVFPAEVQSDSPSEGPTDNPSSSSSGNSSHSSNDLPDLSFPDINLPIALKPYGNMLYISLICKTVHMRYL